MARHRLGGDRSDFNLLVPALLEQGYVVLAYDARGTGRSNAMADGTVVRPGRDPERHRARMPRDVAAGIAHLRHRPDVDARRIAIVGASFGANVAMTSTARRPRPAAAVALSPIAADVLVGRDADERPRATLFIASRAELAGAWQLARRT
nr:alpha/beta fold hydrolase [Thermoleophilaceae bacterium]